MAGSDLIVSPLQYDFIDDNYIVDGPAASNLCKNAGCTWHGHSVAQIITGPLNNSLGAAGSGGQVAEWVELHAEVLRDRRRSGRPRLNGRHMAGSRIDGPLGDPAPAVRIVAAEGVGLYGSGEDVKAAMGVLLPLADPVPSML